MALLAALVILSVWGVAAAGLLLATLGFRRAAAVCGALSILSGAWLLCVLPHVPLLGAANMAAGWIAVSGLFGGNKGGDE